MCCCWISPDDNPAGCPILFAHFAKRVGFHSRLAHGVFRTSRPAVFHHIFLVRRSQTRNRNRAIIPRPCNIENCARLQRRTHDHRHAIAIAQ